MDKEKRVRDVVGAAIPGEYDKAMKQALAILRETTETDARQPSVLQTRDGRLSKAAGIGQGRAATRRSAFAAV